MNNDGRVIHFAGEYEGQEIDLVIELDPEYILWAVENVEGHGISNAQAERARRLIDMDEFSAWEDDSFEQYSVRDPSALAEDY